jgi:protein-S-isoprenylcysteine O-methyltransferase Ste14
VVPAASLTRALETKLPAPVVAILAGACMKAYALGFGVAIDPTPLRMYVGLAFAQASGLIALAALLALWRARTTINPLDPSRASRLVTGGVFRFSRNPFYVSLLILLVAYAVRLDSLAVWLAPALFVAYVTRFQIRPEERALQAKFGEEYRRYQMRTRRWL